MHIVHFAVLIAYKAPSYGRFSGGVKRAFSRIGAPDCTFFSSLAMPCQVPGGGKGTFPRPEPARRA